MKTQEFAIGDEFEMGFKRFKCMEMTGCDLCAFKSLYECDDITQFVGQCVAEDRTDNKSVIFVEVEQ